MGSTRAPAHLSAAMRTWWRTAKSTYELEPHHVLLLTAACEAHDRAAAAAAVISKEGVTVPDRYGVAKVHPAVSVERDARAAFARLVRQLDLDAPPAGGRR